MTRKDERGRVSLGRIVLESVLVALVVGLMLVVGARLFGAELSPGVVGGVVGGVTVGVMMNRQRRARSRDAGER